MNTIRSILVVAWKEIQIIVKDRGSLAILFVLPLVLTSLYGGMNQQFAGTEQEASILIDVCLVNEDPGEYGAQVAGALDEISVLRIEKLQTVAEAEQRVAQGHATAAIVLPATLTERIAAYEPVALQVIVDPARARGGQHRHRDHEPGGGRTCASGARCSTACTRYCSSPASSRAPAPRCSAPPRPRAWGSS